MLKAPTIASAPALPLSVQARLGEKTRPLNAAQANVQARLFNSQPVKKVMDECMGSVRTALKLDEPASVKKKRMRKADYQKESKGKQTPGEDGGVVNGVHTADRGGQSETLARGDRPLVEFDQGSGSDSDTEHGNYKSRLAGSSSDESSSDNDLDSSNYDRIRQKNTNRTPRTNPSLSPSPSPSQFNDPSKEHLISRQTQAFHKPNYDISHSPSPAPPTNPPPPQHAPPPKSTNTTTTTFLPSLTLGGYIAPHSSLSRSPSPQYPEKPKNRRGQRERRLIAEKKHGSKAKHISTHGSVRTSGSGGVRDHGQGSGARDRDRDMGWDGRKGAVAMGGGDVSGRRGVREAGRRGGKESQREGAFDSNRSGKRNVAKKSGANSDPVAQKRTLGTGGKGEETLHPSWQAAKIKKEGGKGAEWKGKKVVFD